MAAGTREIVFTRLLPKTRDQIKVIAAEMAEEAGIPELEPPFYKSDGSINESEIVRRLLAKADSRLREP